MVTKEPSGIDIAMTAGSDGASTRYVPLCVLSVPLRVLCGESV
jgi:hypothetical protein